ncbi:MAG: hypothetical protein HN411_02725 [Waddliaceae bacterium]|jgi:hypothetical protein|nr:hypothetical protein [Waddliaceae bacterium]MBT3578672.1 hypothetical protein [Waddliaceae bacterium]MBT4445391.1 hypothetical protein [Waddliaceae bacterium]MBT6928341.1 hypothetical protein [Waddliaceae bacterium]MBT7265027.1 hypothetical protein [Waddliaceae bacterium]
MKKGIVILYIISVMVFFVTPALFASQDIGVNNRILTKVNGKTITVMDIADKMDVIFSREFPEHTDSLESRYQFYMANWQYILRDMVDKELVLSDALDKKIVISDGDIREELEDMFGSNAIEAVSQLGMTYNEAWSMIHEDIMVRRMMLYAVHSKAMNKTSPQDLRRAFEGYLLDNPQNDEWTYRVLSIRDSNNGKAIANATIANILLTEEGVSFEELSSELSSRGLIEDSTEVKVSAEFHHSDNMLSSSYKEALISLSPGEYSEPIKHQKGGDHSPVYRIFFLKEHVVAEPIIFSDIEEGLKNHLYNAAIAEETELYMASLMKRYGFNEDRFLAGIPKNFEPFIL